MKKLYGSFTAKLIAVILLCLLSLAFVASVTGAIVVNAWDGYSQSYESYRGNLAGSEARSRLYDIGWSVLSGVDPRNLSEYPGLEITILNGEGEELFSNYEGKASLWEGVVRLAPDYVLTAPGDSTEEEWETGDMTIVPHPTPSPDAFSEEKGEAGEELWTVQLIQSGEEKSFSSREEALAWIGQQEITVRGYVPEEQPTRSIFSEKDGLARFLYNWRFAFLWISGLSFLLGVLDFIFLLCAAGHRKGTEAIVPRFVEKIPFDIFTVMILALMAISAAPLTMGIGWPEGLIALIPCGLLVGLLLLLWCMSFAVRVKLGTLLENCLLWRFFRWLWRGLTAVFRNLPILWKWALGVGLFALLDLGRRHSSVFSYNRTTFWWFVCWALIAGATLYAVLAFRRLRKGAQQIASGNMNYAIDEKNLVLDFKDHAHDLNHIRDGLNEAVEERMKSERFRTELITNVSHDIKTPLTSIVNYVDLLAKEEPENEKQREYIEVLQRQSLKLKKLIEDLIEASKASTGNLPVSLAPCDLSILLDQTAGEYSEKLAAASLELVLQKPETPVMVMADGRHLWRVFENLLNNVVKYAMPGTRVYLTLQAAAGQAEVTFRNISREKLAMNAQELTERFVRGDASRSTEGSGLGLAIAMSLMKLQGGEMDLAVDGDLFKVTLRFHTV